MSLLGEISVAERPMEKVELVDGHMRTGLLGKY
jgi:hypothetical protein